jgi:hypothetical protein
MGICSLAEYRSLSDDELTEKKAEALARSAVIADQIGLAKARVFTDGEYADPEWYRLAERAKRRAGLEVQMIQTVEGERRRAERGQLPGVFVDIAREMLDPDVFYDILEMARGRVIGEKSR